MRRRLVVLAAAPVLAAAGGGAWAVSHRGNTSDPCRLQSFAVEDPAMSKLAEIGKRRPECR